MNEAAKVAIESEAFDRAERQRSGLKYARGSNDTGEQTEKFDLKMFTKQNTASKVKHRLNIISHMFFIYYFLQKISYPSLPLACQTYQNAI